MMNTCCQVEKNSAIKFQSLVKQFDKQLKIAMIQRCLKLTQLTNQCLRMNDKLCHNIS